VECKNTDDVHEEREVKQRRAEIGLCLGCVHHALIVSKNGSEFHLCEKNKEDSSFHKYPRLPVLNCKGYQSTEDTERGRGVVE
jgi:hypothetical protein